MWKIGNVCIKINEVLSTNTDFKYNLVLSSTIKFSKNCVLSVNTFNIFISMNNVKIKNVF